MLNVEVNGEKRQIQELSTVADLLVDTGIAGHRVTVERNGGEVSADSYETIVVEDGDVYEIFERFGG